MKRWISLAVIFAVLLIGRVHIAVAESTPPVYFSEIAWAGSDLSPSDEWIELKNNTDQAIDLSGWQITNQSRSGLETAMLNLSQTIPANGYFLIANYSADKSALNIAPDLNDTSVSLSNEHLKLKLYSGDPASAELIDVVGTGSVPTVGSASPHQSMSRRLPLLYGGSSSSWYGSSQSSNFDQGISDLGTPGKVNLAQPYLSGSCTPSSIPKAKSTQVICSGEIYDYNGEEVSGTIEYQNNNSPIASSFGKWEWQTDINPATESQIKLTISASNESGISNEKVIELKTYSLSNKIVVNEVYPSPSSSSSDEWVELFNEGQDDIEITGWNIDDIIGFGSKPYSFPAGTVIKSNGYLIVDKQHSKIAFNNSGDEVNLIDPETNIVASTSYGSIPTDNSWARLNERSFAATPLITKNSANIFPEKNNYFAAIRISEVLPDPDGRDEEGEWVELQSLVDYQIDLSGWKIDDEAEGSSPYTIKDHVILKSFGYLSFDRKQTGIAFNNNEDSVYVYSPDGGVVNYLNYTGSENNLSWSYFEDGYSWTNNLTKNSPNNKATIDTKIVTSAPSETESRPETEENITSNEVNVANIFTLQNVPKITILPLIQNIDIPGLSIPSGKVLGISSVKTFTNQSKWLLSYAVFVIILAIVQPNILLWKSSTASNKPNNSPKKLRPG